MVHIIIMVHTFLRGNHENFVPRKLLIVAVGEVVS